MSTVLQYIELTKSIKLMVEYHKKKFLPCVINILFGAWKTHFWARNFAGERNITTVRLN